MKKIFKVLAIIAFAAIIGFSMVSCSDDDSGGTGSSTPTFTFIADFKTWLDARPDNTEDTPYNVKLNVSYLGGSSSTDGSVGKALIDNNTKYVSLDLSGSSFTSIGSDFANCTSLTHITIPASTTYFSRGTNVNTWPFYGTKLTSIRFERANLSIGDCLLPGIDRLITAYRAGGIGTYTRSDRSSITWTKTSN